MTKDKKAYYVTTAIPYVNAKPHIGHALEFLYGDVITRYQRMIGNTVLFLSGSDENALKNVQAAQAQGKDVQEFVDENARSFESLAEKLHVTFDVFQKGSDTKHHFPSSQELWKRCEKSGDIYKKTYTGLYCVGCETFYDASELDEHGECFEHPGKKIETVSEENYFFRLSRYHKQITDLIESGTLTIVPETRKREVLGFLRQQLQDISISRSNERAKNWGVPVPGDPSQRMYVWFDALNIYQSGIGFGWDEKTYQAWWPADVHVIGKGIIRFHAVYWPAFLLSAQLPLPKSLFVHGYVTVDGKKMSKTVGNVVDPFSLLTEFGVDAVRYYFLREIPSYGDGDFSHSRFVDVYNADLANGWGNLVARVAKLSEKAGITITNYPPLDTYHACMNEFRFNDALAYIWKEIARLDKHINDTQPWELEQEKLLSVMVPVAQRVHDLAYLLSPFLPETSECVMKQYSGAVHAATPLFPRITRS